MLAAGAAGCAPGDAEPGSPGEGPSATSSRAATPVVTPSPSPAPLPTLPRGHRILFPKYRLVGFSGHPASPAFGRLGVGDLDDRVREIEAMAPAHAGGREVLPVLELIAVIAQAAPGKDGRYRARVDDAVISTYLAAARKHRAMLLLNVQPGRADFLTEVKALEKWLREPDVGLALDPEWAVGPRQRPGRVYGRTTGKELNAVADYVNDVVARNRLPQKPMVVHQLAPQIVSGLNQVRRQPGVVVIQSVDGIGNRAEKENTWRKIVKDLPWTVRPGFKLFYEEDTRRGHPLMTPAQVLALTPQPEYILYE